MPTTTSKQKRNGKRTRNLFDPSSKKPFQLSRSKIDLFQQCRRCFHLDRRLGVARPRMPPFTLNSAVDALLKREFDEYREQQRPHPIMVENQIDAVPFQHPDLDTWRSNFKGVRFHHEPTNLIISGAVDDVWINPKGELLIVDYKATASKERLITLDTKWRQGYKRQLEIYQWLFRMNGFSVSNSSFIVYANAEKDRDAFNGELKFKLQLIEHVGDTEWVEQTVIDAHACLMSDEIPDAADDCEYCGYWEAALEVTGRALVSE